jgi:hypothetical protein
VPGARTSTWVGRDRRAAQIDLFGDRHKQPRKPLPAWQPGLFTAEHEAMANAEAWEAALERFRRLGRGEDELPARDGD